MIMFLVQLLFLLVILGLIYWACSVMPFLSGWPLQIVAILLILVLVIFLWQMFGGGGSIKL